MLRFYIRVSQRLHGEVNTRRNQFDAGLFFSLLALSPFLHCAFQPVCRKKYAEEGKRIRVFRRSDLFRTEVCMGRAALHRILHPVPSSSSPFSRSIQGITPTKGEESAFLDGQTSFGVWRRRLCIPSFLLSTFHPVNTRTPLVLRCMEKASVLWGRDSLPGSRYSVRQYTNQVNKWATVRFF